MNFLQKLPNEVWLRIFDKLDKTEDLLPVCNACQRWKSLLNRTKTEWMFQGVFPLLIKYLKKDDIDNCRLVSKRWSRGVDHYLQFNQPYVTAAGDPTDHKFDNEIRIYNVDFNETSIRRHKTLVEVFESFQKEFSADNESTTEVRNPFVSRSAVLTISHLYPTVVEIFEKHGPHLWCLDLTVFLLVRHKPTPPLKIAKFILNILSHVPNLKKLILGTREDYIPLKRLVLCEEEKMAQIIEVRQYLESNPAPSLPCLNNLQLTGNTSYLLRKALTTAYAPQLQKFVHYATDCFVPENFPKLKELVWYYRSDCSTCPIKILSKLKSPSLERLYIVVVESHIAEENPAQRLFEELETFKNSLKYLYLRWTWFEPSFPSQLDLPFVEEFSLKIEDCKNPMVINISFLKSLKSLRKLRCFIESNLHSKFQNFRANENFYYQFCREESQLMEERVDFWCHLDADINGGLCSSNVWRLVPSLETIEVHVLDAFQRSPFVNINTYTRVGRDIVVV